MIGERVLSHESGCWEVCCPKIYLPVGRTDSHEMMESDCCPSVLLTVKAVTHFFKRAVKERVIVLTQCGEQALGNVSDCRQC